MNNVNDIVISTRIRLARNLKDYPFPCRLNTEQQSEILSKVKTALQEESKLKLIELDRINEVEAVALVERHLCSPEFISKQQNRGLFLSGDETVSIMVNEEDHIRIQVIMSGLDFEKAYAEADRIDNVLSTTLNFAFDNKLGFLTQCPTNLGTGMRASIMLHLPALTENRAIGRIAENLSKLGLTMRGLFGEGSEPRGAIFQLSNQVTLGIKEKEAIENLKNISMQLISQELAARENMLNNLAVKDRIYRSVGILKTARLMTNQEGIALLSNVALGSGILQNENVDLVNIYKIMTSIEPAMMMKRAGKKLAATERDELRATYLREQFANIQ
ncbi:MAG: protein arginine kinase [Bacillota bacterium]|nr:protein arginine kinase [Bacillota bacterium]